MNMKFFNILHFSDLHFGQQNMQKYAKYKLDFDNYFIIFKEKIESIINEEKNTLLVILTGDLGSRGKIVVNKYLNEFLEIFSQNEIPILTCLGNHDLIQDKITLNEQFNEYVSKIRAIQKVLGCNEGNSNYIYKLSKNFSMNQASYIYVNDMKALFISVNSCKNIEKEFIGMDIRGKKLYDQDKLDVAFLSARDLVEIREEIKETIGDDKFSEAYKFLLCHHTVMNNKYEKELILNFLNDNNLRIIFSGHIHEYRLNKNLKLNLNNFIAGSPFVIPEERSKDNEFKTSDLQFSQYKIDAENKTIYPYVYEYRDKKWVVNKKNGDKVGFTNETYKNVLNLFRLINDIYPDHYQIYEYSSRNFYFDLNSRKLELQLSGITALYEGLATRRKKKLDFLLWEKLTDKYLDEKGIKNEILSISINNLNTSEFYKRIILKAMIYGKEMYETHRIN